MNPLEHVLVMVMLAKLQTRHRALLDVLKAKGILDDEEIKAFEFVASEDVLGNEPSLRHMFEEWNRQATALGIERLGLPKSLQPQNRQIPQNPPQE